MIIAIDGYEANVPRRVGIGRYAYELLVSIHTILQSRLGPSPIPSVRVYLPSTPLDDMPSESARWSYRIVKPKRFWTFMGLPFSLLTDEPRADMIFSPTHYMPRFINIPRVIAIMDLSYLVYPNMFRQKDLHQLTAWTKYAVARAASIVTISQYTKNAIMEAYQVPQNRITVTYPGFSRMNAVTGVTKDEIMKKYRIRSRYILSVGTIQPRKNYVRLIEAFSRLLKENKGNDGLELVIVGKKGWLYEETLETPEKFGVKDRVKFLDFVPDSDLPALYTHAHCFALPSLYEGFGLPVLEAMAYGCPVVISDSSSLPEIAGKAGIYVQPDDVTSITQGLMTALSERNQKIGKLRIQEGLRHVKKFSWESAARQTLAILEEVGNTS